MTLEIAKTPKSPRAGAVTAGLAVRAFVWHVYLRPPQGSEAVRPMSRHGRNPWDTTSFPAKGTWNSRSSPTTSSRRRRRPGLRNPFPRKPLGHGTIPISPEHRRASTNPMGFLASAHATTESARIAVNPVRGPDSVACPGIVDVVCGSPQTDTISEAVVQLPVGCFCP